MHRCWNHSKYHSAYKRWVRAFRYGCRWLEENTHIQQFWLEFHRHMYGPGQCCKKAMCRIRSNRLPWSVWLKPLDKNPGLRSIGVGEVIRGIIGKAVVHTLKEDIIRSVGKIQACAGHELGYEAAIHAMSQIFKGEDWEAVRLIDASNGFNALNRTLFLQNINVIYPEIAVFVRNCYSLSLRLFIIGGSELKSCERLREIPPQWRYMQLL